MIDRECSEETNFLSCLWRFGSLLKTEHMGKPWNNESAEKWWACGRHVRQKELATLRARKGAPHDARGRACAKESQGLQELRNGTPNSVQALQTPQLPSGSVGVHSGARTTPPRTQGTGACGGMKGRRCTPLPTDHAAAEHVRGLPQGRLGPPAARGPRVEPRGARAGRT